MAMIKTCKMPDLQTKSASGAVATFNTALAMPLKSHTVALTATQSGSGTPSPQNIRSINGWDNIHISTTGKNLFSYNGVLRNGYWFNGFVGNNSILDPTTSAYWAYYLIPVKAGDYITGSGFDGTGGTSCAFLSSNNPNDIISTFGSAQKNATYLVPNNAKYVGLVINNVKDCITNFPTPQIEVNNVATAYESFGNIYTIQIGSTVYGGEYDARTGLFTVTNKYFSFDYTSAWMFEYSGAGRNFYIICPTDIKPNQYAWNSSMICSASPISTSQGSQKDHCFISATRNFNFTWGDTLDISTAQDFKDYLQANNIVIEVVAELATPQTIQLQPCPIDTLEGVNNIWADTGDVDLTYKDLDIAKRGNFREVFKLP